MALLNEEENLLFGGGPLDWKPEEKPEVVPLTSEIAPLASVVPQQDLIPKEIGTSLQNTTKLGIGKPESESQQPMNWQYAQGLETAGVYPTTQFSSVALANPDDKVNTTPPVIIDNTNTGGGNKQEFVNETNSKGQPILDWGNLKESWGAMDLAGKAGVVAGIAGHAATLVSILDGSWAESQKKIIGMGKYHGVGRTWRNYA